ncbi:MAG: GGDEF domain-containing protein [Longicatena sp.]
MINYLKSLEAEEQHEKYEYYCDRLLRHYEVASYPINWNGRKALVHYIKDVSIEKEKAESLFTLAYQDDLTRISNRRYCLETLMKFVDNRECFSLVVLDLDGMKHVNDTYGHLSGDDYLCSVVEVVKANLRDSSLFFRIGGDEFVIILKDSNREVSCSLMKKIREDICNTKREYNLSISYGITYVSGGQYHSPKEILSVSDERMYEFKKEHRNKKSLNII